MLVGREKIRLRKWGVQQREKRILTNESGVWTYVEKIRLRIRLRRQV